MKTHATTKEVFVCSLCKAECSTKWNLKKHIIDFHGNEDLNQMIGAATLKKVKKGKPLAGSPRCAICNTSFKRKENLRNHIRSFHPSNIIAPAPKPRCDICSEEFVTVSNVKRHILQTHVHTSNEVSGCSYIILLTLKIEFL